MVESVYSMTGEVSPLHDIIASKKEYDFKLYVDEAHGFGIYGKNGMGYCEELDVLDDVDFIMSSFSKVTGSIGGLVAMDEKYATYINWTSRSYLFQAAIPAFAAAAILACLDEIQRNPSLAKKVHQTAAYFRSQLNLAGSPCFVTSGLSPIVPVLIPPRR